MIKVTLGEDRRVLVSENTYVYLGNEVSENEEMAKLVETHTRKLAIEAEKKEKEMTEGLHLTPQEFMDRYQKKQTAK